MGMAAIGLKTANSLPVSRILQRWSGSSFSSKAPTHASTCSRRPPTSQACRNPAGPSTQPLSDAGWQAAAQDAIHWPSRGAIEACNGHAGRPTAASNQHFSNQAEGPGHSVTRHHARLQPGATKSQHMQGGQHTQCHLLCKMAEAICCKIGPCAAGLGLNSPLCSSRHRVVFD